MKPVLPLLCLLWTVGLYVSGFGQKPAFDHTNFFEEIPCRFVAGKILIPVEIEGETYDFILDSGGLLVLSNEVAAKCNFDTLGARNVSGINQKSASFAEVRVPEVKIGNLSFNNFVGLAGSFFEKYPISCLEADGLIGRDFINRMIVQYDLRHDRIILTDQRERLNLDPLYRSKMGYYDSGIPELTINTSRGKLKHVRFDSGSDDILSLQTRKAAKLQRKASYKGGIQPLYGSFSRGISMTLLEPSLAYMAYYPSVDIGSVSFKEVYTEESKKSGSRIGAGIMEFGLVTTDYLDDGFYFEPYNADSLTVQPVFETFGFYVIQAEDTWQIAGVAKGSEAETKGIAPRQKILTINGLAIQDQSYEADCALYIDEKPWEAGDQVELVVEQADGEQLRVVLEKYRWE